ncbi:MAG: GldM family protein [Bacteroidota bacterium]
MSIPKEPRQLMINIMYLVLTAMLALNVSAEVMNAFFTLDEGNTASMGVVDDQLDATVNSLNDLLNDSSKERFKPIQPAVQEVRSIAAEFNTYVDELRDLLVDAAGNRDGEVNAGDFKAEHDGDLHYIKGKKNKDVTTRLLVEGDPNYNGGKPYGEELKEKIIETRQRLIDSYTTLLRDHGENMDQDQASIDRLIQSVATEMPFKIDDETWKESKDKSSWRDFKFRQMPVAAVLPLLSSMQSDLKIAEANMVNSMAQLAGGKVVDFDSFFPVVAADRSYVVSGESINAKVSVGTYSTSLDPSNVTITANGRPLTVNSDGTADLTIPASGVGQKTVNLGVSVRNPLTDKVTEGDGTFVYEVGTRSVAVSADKMNVFYIGVDNPISISASGVSSNAVRINKTGPITISGSGASRMVRASAPGDATIRVSADGQSLGSFPFRVKRIPDPQARLGSSTGGNMGTGEFKAQRGIRAVLDGFDFDARCNIAGFELVYVPKREDAVLSNNPGPVYNNKSKNLVNRARPGDSFYFNNVRAKCPGDQATRKINTMVFTIK